MSTAGHIKSRILKIHKQFIFLRQNTKNISGNEMLKKKTQKK